MRQIARKQTGFICEHVGRLGVVARCGAETRQSEAQEDGPEICLRGAGANGFGRRWAATWRWSIGVHLGAVKIGGREDARCVCALGVGVAAGVEVEVGVEVGVWA